MKNLRKLRPTQMLRNKQQLKMALNVQAIVLSGTEGQQEKASSLIRKFLFKRSVRTEFKALILDYIASQQKEEE